MSVGTVSDGLEAGASRAVHLVLYLVVLTRMPGGSLVCRGVLMWLSYRIKLNGGFVRSVWFKLSSRSFFHTHPISISISISYDVMILILVTFLLLTLTYTHILTMTERMPGCASISSMEHVF